VPLLVKLTNRKWKHGLWNTISSRIICHDKDMYGRQASLADICKTYRLQADRLEKHEGYSGTFDINSVVGIEIAAFVTESKLVSFSLLLFLTLLLSRRRTEVIVTFY